jgi:hypothetical protein
MSTENLVELGTISISIRTLAKDTGLSCDCVEQGLAQAEACGHVKVERSYRHGRLHTVNVTPVLRQGRT